MQPVKVESIFGYKSLNSLLDGSKIVSVLESIDARLDNLVKGDSKSVKKEGTGTSDTSMLITLKKVLDIDKNVKAILSKLGGDKNTLNTLGDPKEFAILGTGLQKIVRALISAKLITKGSVNILFSFLEKVVPLITEISKNSSGFNKGLADLGNLGSGIFKLGGYLLLSAPLYVAGQFTTKLIGATIKGLASALTLSKEQQEGIKVGADNLKKLAAGVLFLGLALVAAVPLYAIGALGAVAFTLAMIVMIPVFMILNKWKKGIKEGGEALTWMSLGIITTGLSLLFWKLLNIDYKTVLSAVLTIGSLGLVFGLLGMAKKYIVDGAWAVAGMGISILFLGLTIKAWSALGINMFEFDATGALSGNSKKTAGVLGTMLAVIAGLGFVYTVLGKMKSDIIKGAVGMIIAGLSLIVIAYGVKEFSKISITWDQLAIMGATILGLGALMAGAGALASMIGQGALVMMLSGLALVPIAFGINSFIKTGVTYDQLAVMGATILGLGTLMTGAGLVAPLIGIGAAVMLLAGAALVVIASGVGKFSSLNLKVSSGDDLSGVNKQIEYVIGSIVDAFFINPFKTAAILLSAPVLMIAGATMVVIGSALNKFKSLGFDSPDKVTALMSNIKMIIGGIVETFSSISNPIDAFLGVQATKDIGQSLNGIATGLVKFVELDKNFPGLDFTPGSPLMNNISSVITGVASAFAAISAGPIFSEAENGINATKNIGQSLMGIADGMLKFTDPKFTDVFAPDENGKSKMMDLVVNMITSVMGAFANIGAQNDGGSNLFGFTITEGNVDKGISLTKRSSEALTSIADGVMKFKDFTPDQISTATGNINTIIKALLSEFSDENGKTLDNVDKYIDLMERLADITDPLMKVAKAMSTIAKETGNFVSHFKTMDPGFFDIYTRWTEALVKIGEADTGTFAENASNFLSSSIGAVGNLFGGSSSDEAPAQNTVSEPVTQTVAPASNSDNELVNAISQLVTAINTLTSSNDIANKEIINKLSKLPASISAQIASQTLSVKNSNS